ncbi:MAG: LysR family transcriptional regulator [Hydrogenophilus sp.]|nr:LysR family transcriptional regulator [Hydrogenophilus sp.]
MKHVTMRQLRIFATVAKEGSISKAADKLFLTPPAVSMQIKELEAQVGMALFERSARRFTLTTVGEYFLIYARRILDLVGEAEELAKRLQEGTVGELRIGMVSTAQYLVPRMLGEFRREHPGITLSLRVGNRRQVVQMLEAREVDVVVMGRPPEELKVRAEAFAGHPSGFVAAPDHPLCDASGEIDPRLVAQEPLIVREEGSGTRSAMNLFFAERRVTPKIAMQMESNETIKQAVMSGLGLAFLSLHTIAMEVRHGYLRVLPVRGTPVMRAWYVVHRTSQFVAPAVEAFRYYLLERGQTYVQEHFPGGNGRGGSDPPGRRDR